MPKVLEAIRFDRENHSCWRGKERLPSVGTVLKKAAAVFNPWAKDLPTPETQAKMDRGRVIHETLELFDLGTLKEYDPICEPYIRAMKAVKEFLGIREWGSVEEWVADPELGYWGIIDRYHKRYGCLDVKTGTSRLSSYRIQVAGYCGLKGTDKGMVIYLPEDRPWHPMDDVEKIGPKDIAAWKMALKLSGRER